MATLIEGTWFTLTEAAAEHMVEIGLISKCNAQHLEVLEVDKPIYHISIDAPMWFGFGTIRGAIATAELATFSMKENNEGT